jgi:hypothetical protein
MQRIFLIFSRQRNQTACVVRDDYSPIAADAEEVEPSWYVDQKAIVSFLQILNGALVNNSGSCGMYGQSLWWGRHVASRWLGHLILM